MRMRFAALGMLIFAVACARPPVTDDLRIEFSNTDDVVVVTADTTFEMKPFNDVMKHRVDVARAAAIASTDPWAARFSALRPSADSTFMRRDRGVLERVTRSVTIPPDDLQLVFADANITVKTMRGDGWREVSFYPGSSTRASREQLRDFNAELNEWSNAVARYFRAVHELYAYLGRQPHRAKWVFAAILIERGADGAEPLVLEEEQPLVDAVQNAMAEIGDRMDANEGRAATFGEQADLIFNPFPARITVRVPGTVLASDGFSKKEKDLVIEPIDLFQMLQSLEGKWISPDPLAALLRDEGVTASDIAFAERRSTMLVTGADVADEIRSQLERPKSYVVRWRE